MAIVKKVIIAVLMVLLCGACVTGVVMISRDLAETPSNTYVYVQNVEFDTDVINFNMAD